jgi:hypothetical protein
MLVGNCGGWRHQPPQLMLGVGFGLEAYDKEELGFGGENQNGDVGGHTKGIWQIEGDRVEKGGEGWSMAWAKCQDERGRGIIGERMPCGFGEVDSQMFGSEALVPFACG